MILCSQVCIDYGEEKTKEKQKKNKEKQKKNKEKQKKNKESKNIM